MKCLTFQGVFFPELIVVQNATCIKFNLYLIYT